MMGKLWKKCLNYETVSYVVCGVLTTAVDFVSYSLFRRAGMDVAWAQALSWSAAVLFAYVANKLAVFRNFDFAPAHLVREAGSFLAARVFSGVLTWILMLGLVWIGGDRGFLYELFCKALVSVVNLVFNYVASKLWVFKKASQ